MEVCSPAEVKLITDVMRQWCPTTTPEVRAVVGAYVFAGSKHSCYLTQVYLHRVKQLAPWMLEVPARDMLINGFMYYVANLLFAMCHYTTLERLHGPKMCIIVEDRLLKISLVCVIADFVLDTATPELRRDIGLQIYDLLKAMGTGKPLSADGTVEPRIHSAAIILQELIREVPGALPTVVTTFTAEVASGAQQDGQPSYTELLALEGKKGALTYELVGVIINNGVSLKVPYELGYLIQLYDDLADMYIDEKEKTWTVVSASIATEGSVDRLFWEMAGAIDRLPPQYWPFKVVCCIFMAAIAATNPYVSPTLTALLRPYALMADRGKDTEDIPLYRDAVYAHFEHNVPKV